MRFMKCALVLSFCVISLARAEDKKYTVVKTMPIGGEGGWDYVTVDPPSHRLYVTRSSHTQVIDSESGKVIADIPGQTRSHGVAIVPDAGRGFISDGGNTKDGGAIVIFDLKTNEVLGKLNCPEDADGIIYDPASKHVFCVAGRAKVLIPIAPDVDPKTGKIDAPIDLGGEPEFLATDGQGKVFVNVMDTNQVAVIDTKTMKVASKWAVAPGGSPVGMAIDTDKHRIFIGCRNPQKMIVMSTEDGKVQADLPIGAGVDAVKFDDGSAFASCRDASLPVVRETSPGKFEVAQTVQTKPGARTMGLDPATHTLYLPTAEYSPAAAGQRPAVKPGTFMLLVVAPQ